MRGTPLWLLAAGLVTACSEREPAPGRGQRAFAAEGGGGHGGPTEGVAHRGPPDAGEVDKGAPPLVDEELYPTTLAEQREAMLRRMEASLRLAQEQLDAVRRILAASPVIGQGNPAVSGQPMTRKACRYIRQEAGVVDEDKPACGAPFMVPLYDRAGGEGEADAKVCMDRYEFPGIPCEHPVVWPTAREAAALCEAVGKRLCDAHEWEGACAGSLREPEDEYAFGKKRTQMASLHNRDREITWAYGSTKDHARCATGSWKNERCTEGGWKKCGSNTYPAGAFPGCVSPLGVYDLHGNAAEHMNLPLKPEEMASAGGMGWTEMKGSWFIFSTYEAHIDDCRWRAPAWHESKVMDVKSHQNYHLGFRCCKSLP